VVQQKIQATIRTTGSTIRLFFHDCFVEVQIDFFFQQIEIAT